MVVARVGLGSGGSGGGANRGDTTGGASVKLSGWLWECGWPYNVGAGAGGGGGATRSW
jgi:hypothetical protein